ncbi:MAG: hypothetical protein QE263_06175 [Vampirovibrionales bacterium]|nr:hypothetical protein [Vampirovibrionales bacterium]
MTLNTDVPPLCPPSHADGRLWLWCDQQAALEANPQTHLVQLGQEHLPVIHASGVGRLLAANAAEDALRPLSARQWLKLNEGVLHQTHMLERLAELGYWVTAQQQAFERVITNDLREPVARLVGHVDALAVGFGTMLYPQPWVVEVKAVSPQHYEAWHDEDTLKADALGLCYWHQLHTYLGLAKVKEGVLILKNKVSGQWRCVPVGFKQSHWRLALQAIKNSVMEGPS